MKPTEVGYIFYLHVSASTDMFIKNERALKNLISYTNKINSNNINLQIHKFNALSYAHNTGDIDIFKCLIENQEKYNCDITKNIYDFLYDSCINQHIEIVKYILNYCIRTNNIININLRTGYKNLFCIIVKQPNINILKCLIEYGEKINSKYDTSYVYTFYYRQLEIKYVSIYNYKYVHKTYNTILRYFVYLKKHNYKENVNDICALTFMIISKYINNNKRISTYLDNDYIDKYKGNYMRIVNMYISNNILRFDASLIYHRYIEYSFCIKRIYNY